MKASTNPGAGPSYIGIDYHKRYSAFRVLGGHGQVVERGRIEHGTPDAFAALVKR